MYSVKGKEKLRADEDALHRKAFRTERFNLIQNKL